MNADPTRTGSNLRPVHGARDERQPVDGHDSRSPQSMRRPGIADRFADLLRPSARPSVVG